MSRRWDRLVFKYSSLSFAAAGLRSSLLLGSTYRSIQASIHVPTGRVSRDRCGHIGSDEMLQVRQPDTDNLTQSK